jgi:DNA-binding NarL/FixJ family response regulator
MSQIKIAIVDDHPIFLSGLNFVISQYPDFQVIMQASNGAEFIDNLQTASPLPDVVLLDVEMPRMNGLECSAVLRAKFPSIKIIILTMHDQPSYVKHLVELGVDSYLLKDRVGAEVEKAVRLVANDERYFDPHIQQILLNELLKKQSSNTPKHNILLGRREKEVLDLLHKHKNKHEIADELSISVYTVETHRKNLLRKFEVHSVTELLFKAVKFELVEID